MKNTDFADSVFIYIFECYEYGSTTKKWISSAIFRLQGLIWTL